MNEKNLSVEEQIRQSNLSDEGKQKLNEIARGERLADLYYDAVAKHVFSPDVHPERMEFILR